MMSGVMKFDITWARTLPNCFAELGSARHEFIIGELGSKEYEAQFPTSAFGYIYTPEEQKAQWNVILEARKWISAMWLIETGVTNAINQALKIIENL